MDGVMTQKNIADEENAAWKQKTDAAIDKINTAIRQSHGWDYPGARYGMPRAVADAIKAQAIRA